MLYVKKSSKCLKKYFYPILMTFIIFQYIHKICFHPILMTFMCDTKIDIIVCESLCIKLFFVNISLVQL